MYRQPVTGIGFIELVLGPKILQKLWERKRIHPHLPEPSQIVTDFQALGGKGGVPAAVQLNKQGEAMLLLYTLSYYLAAFTTAQGDGYRISYIEPLDLREHERLSKGVLMLQTPNWRICDDVRNLLGKPNYWSTIQGQWRALEEWRRRAGAEAGQELEGLAPAHENYLNTLSTLVEVTHKLEQDKNKLPDLIPYGSVESTGEERYARDVYDFRLVGTPRVDKKNLLRLKEAPDLQGRVFDFKSNILTVKFENVVDRARIPAQGNFEPIVSGAVYRTQQEAIETLREGESKNKHLLRVLVDRRYQPYRIDATVLPAVSLNPKQLEAFRCAITVPDLLLVLGPPGTGKTRTIAEIARQCGLRRQRVLITSKTHKAVDNVLERLPNDLTVVRFGHEDRVAESIRTKLIDEQAKEMQEKILQRTGTYSHRLANFAENKGPIDRCMNELKALIEQLTSSEQLLYQSLQLRSYAEQRIRAQYQPGIDALSRSLQNQQAEINYVNEQIGAWTKKRVAAESKEHYPVLGTFFQWRAGSHQKSIEAALAHITEVQSAYATTNQQYLALQNQQARALATDPEYQRHITAIPKLEDNCSHLKESAAKAVNILQGTVQNLAPLPPQAVQHDVQTLRQFVMWFDKTRSLLEKRAQLQQDWRKELKLRTDQLIPELLRYADVVGATCIGVATAKGLAEIDFDLAIVDEAGQICLPDLLVPLVRARRCVLVGDHHQLPPFVDSEVQTWLDSLSPQTQQELGLRDEETDSEYITELLTKSTFEQLFTWGTDQNHMQRFIEQRRMPQVIADFAALHFYDKQLQTSGEDKLLQAAHHDPLFRRPLAFVDTSDEPPRERREMKRIATENWGIEGYTNHLEAILIARIAALYDQEGAEWVVIVPYRAQAHLIIQQLRNRIETRNFKLEDRVATVDSFQGGERDKVIFGFTRSNDDGKIGFLKELRRLNVAMTRAKQQLVLIGDLSTLTQAKHEDFRKVAVSLQAYTQQRGELLTYKECQNRLPQRS